MTQLAELGSSMAALHARIAKLLATCDPAVLQRTMVTEEWKVLDVIGHVNAWGLEFFSEARHMAENPGKPFTYEINTANNYDDENNRLVQERKGWGVEQHVEENRRLSEVIRAFFESFAGELPDHAVPLPWEPRPTSIAEVLRVHARHGRDHLDEILEALGVEN